MDLTDVCRLTNPIEHPSKEWNGRSHPIRSFRLGSSPPIRVEPLEIVNDKDLGSHGLGILVQ